MNSSSNQASNFVSGVDTAFLIILGISVFFLVAITITMIYFIYKYNQKRNPKATQIKGSTKLEIVWTVIPTILVLVMFYFGWAGWKPMKEIPKDAMEVTAVARMWSFQFAYENGKITDSLYVPLDRPVVLNLEALDVIHSLYIPAFRVKEDMNPGKIKQMWFIPTREGDYNMFCAEYCGLQHSYMTTKVKVLPQEEFDNWYADTTAILTRETEGGVPGVKGFAILKQNGCTACHSSDGSKLVGPSFLGRYGTVQKIITEGVEREITVDDDYVRKSVYEPNADIAKGYNSGLMLSYKDLISAEDFEEIFIYIRNLNEGP